VIRAVLVFSIASLIAAPLAVSAAPITIQTVPVGNAGNANDPLTGNLYGGVNYDYRIGTTEVTVGQYTAFLNSVATSDPHSLYSPLIGSQYHTAGIARSGTSGSYAYSVIGSPNQPVTNVSWADAARFTNWLHNGQPVGPQNASTTEDGAYTLVGATVNAAMSTVNRNADATWFIPSESEWYKAAYYDPGSNTYNQYPTSSNTVPTSAPPGSTPNTANFYDPITGFAVTGTTSFSGSQNYLTDAGAYSMSAGPYGTFDQGGNVAEWNESLIDYMNAIYGYDLSSDPSYGDYLLRGIRGGSDFENADSLSSSSRLRNFGYSFFADWDGVSYPYQTSLAVGFRVAAVAAVPEPSTFTLAALSFVTLVATGRRRPGCC